MKHTLLVLCLLLLAGPGASAQNSFAPVGAEWWYGGNNRHGSFIPLEQSWLQHVQAVGDTALTGIPCRKLTITGTLPFVPTAAFKNPLYVYDNTDTVFVFSERAGKFIPLYIFNVQQGDTICLSGLFQLSGDSTFCYIVDSVGTELVDTSHLKAVYTRSFSPGKNYSVNWGPARPTSQGPWQSRGKYVERLGGVWPLGGVTIWPVFGSFFPALTTHVIEGSNVLLTEMPYGDFRCYADASHFVKLDTVACDRQYLGLEDFHAPTGCTVFPNPARDRITIKAEAAFEKNAKYSLYDVTGRLLLEQPLPAGRKEAVLSVGSMGAGLYYLVVSRQGAKYYQKIILQP